MTNYRAVILRRTELAGPGCFQQAFGIVCLVLGFITIPIIVPALLLIPFGLWMVAAGGRNASWYECSICASRVTPRCRLCPHCNTELEPPNLFWRAGAWSVVLLVIGWLLLEAFG